MKKIALTLLSLLLTFACIAQVSVRGYYRKNGTYVQPHMRSSPDGNPYNNYSYPGNTNPYTGKVATGNPDTYLKNYYNRNSSSTGSSSSSATFPSNNSSSTYSSPPTYPSNSTASSNSLSSQFSDVKSSTDKPTIDFEYHRINTLTAKRKYLKDANGRFTGESLMLTYEDEEIKKYTLYDVNDFKKGTLVVYSNGDRALFNNFGKIIARNKYKHN
jgi:hypothetical protein